jgi:hypothetical protein
MIYRGSLRNTLETYTGKSRKNSMNKFLDVFEQPKMNLKETK